MSIKTVLKRMLDGLGIPAYWLRQDAREIQALFVRMWACLPVQRWRIARILKRDTVRLNFGCGETQYDGWVGVDQFFARHIDVVIDLRRRLPFPDVSVDLCYSEHFLEHLYPDEGQRHLNEVYRVLKPHGRYRVVVPDVLKFAKKYLEGDAEFFSRAFPWATRPMEALYCVANWNGRHRNILDAAELGRMGHLAGFGSVRTCTVNGSDVSDLRIDRADPQRVEESLYVEFRKSAR